MTLNFVFGAPVGAPAREQSQMEIAVTEEHRGKCLKLNFIIMFTKLTHAEKLSTEYNIDNLAESRFKFVANGITVVAYLSLKKHELAKDCVVQVNVNSDVPKYSQLWMCTEHWIDWQQIGTFQREITLDNCMNARSTINLTVIKEKVFIANNIYEDINWTDFILSATDGCVSVHKACLAAHSKVFEAMLSQEWKETMEGHLKIDGVTLQTLQHLKQYMYLGTLPDDGLRPLLQIAMYYLMDELKSECVSKLARTVSSENLDDLLKFAAENKVPELTFAILEITTHDVVHGAYQLRETMAVSEKEL